MKTFVSKAALGLVAGATLLAAAAPAQAQSYRYDHDGDNTGAVIVAGIAGLAIGAALAADNNRGYDYDRRYYDQRYYYDRGGYDRRYYQPTYNPYNGYYRDDYRRQSCSTRRVWDPYLQRRVKVRYCR